MLKIHQIKDYTISCLFNNGESRLIDFQALFKKWNIHQRHPAWPLVSDIHAFQQVQLIDGTLAWPNIPISFENELGEMVQSYFDLYPIVLYENSEKDPDRILEIGLMIKQARKELGLTQAELAEKSGLTKHYISRLENNKMSPEIMTLKRIVEGGLGKKLRLEID